MTPNGPVSTHICPVAHKSVRLSQMLESLSFAHFKNNQFVDATRCLQKILHINPSLLYVWFNLSYVREEHGVAILGKQYKTVQEVRSGMGEIECAILVFRYLQDGLKSTTNPSHYDAASEASFEFEWGNAADAGLKLSYESAKKHAKYCQVGPVPVGGGTG